MLGGELGDGSVSDDNGDDEDTSPACSSIGPEAHEIGGIALAV